MTGVAQKRPYATLESNENQSNETIMSCQDKRFCKTTLSKLKKHPYAVAFLQPVDPVYFNIPDYFDIIKHPMDLSTIQKKIDQYQSKEEFISDVQLMLDNCYLYNSALDPIYSQAKEVEKAFQKQLSKERSLEKKTELSMPEEEFKLCGSVLKEFKKSKHGRLTWAFENPVDATAWGATDYYDVIKEPMDLSTIESKWNTAKYANESQFYNDYKLMFRNCYQYNPPHNDVHQLGKKFEDLFDKFWDKIHGKLKVEKIPEKSIMITPPPTQDDITEDIDIQSNTSNTPNEGRNVLRIKLNIKKPKTEAKTFSPKPAVRIPGLALSKDPPKSVQPPSPLVDKKEPSQLKDSWINQTKKRTLESSNVNKQSVTDTIPPVTSAEPMFDIGDLFNKINDEKLLRQQQQREEKERHEREEKLRRERDRKRYEEQMAKRREFRERMIKKRERDSGQRVCVLNERMVDISSQKMSSHKFESSILSKDLDWRELNNWQRETVDYRHIPVPAFVRRSPINLKELRSKLLNKSVRLKNASQPQKLQTSQDSDMEID
ncbi:Bromodomain-containing protein [Sporodiniella umbellata]|nr:Bromodomain-containing protein [Sporodiniella umbellata]